MIFPVSSIRDPVHLRISIPQTWYHRLREIKLSCILYEVCVLFIFRICTGYVQISQINLCTMTHYFANIVHHAFIVCIFSSVYMSCICIFPFPCCTYHTAILYFCPMYLPTRISIIYCVCEWDIVYNINILLQISYIVHSALISCVSQNSIPLIPCLFSEY